MLLLLAASFLPQESSFADHFQTYLSGRLRGDSTFDQLNGEDRHAGMLRVRLGSTFDVTRGLTGEIRVTTTSEDTDANNPYWDFGGGSDGFSGSELALDRFFLNWQVEERTLEFRGGMMPHAFSMPPGSNALLAR